MSCRIFQTFDSADDTLWCDHSLSSSSNPIGTFLLACVLVFARITYPAPQIPKHLSRRLHFHLPQFIFVLCVVLVESVDESCGVTIEINPP